MKNVISKSKDRIILEEKFPEYIKQIEKNYWWNFGSVILDASLYSFSIAMLSQDTIIPYFVSQLTPHKWIVGLIPAIFYFGYFGSQLIGAYIVDGKATKKNTIIKIAIIERIGIFFIALIAQYLGVLSNTVALWLLLFAYGLFSITNGMISPAYSDFISKNIIRNRGRFYGILGGLGGIIGLSSSYLATYLLNKFSFPINLRYLFWIGLSISALSPIIISMLKEVPYPEIKRRKPIKEFLRSIPKIINQNAKFKMFMIIRAFIGFGIMANAFYALYAMDKFSQGPEILGIFTMVILLAQSVSGFFWGWLGDKFGFHLNYIIVSFLIIVIGLIALNNENIYFFYIIAFSIGCIYSAFSTSDPNMIFEMAPPSDTSLYIGISSTLIAPTTAIAPLLGGLIIDWFSFPTLFNIVMGIGIICLLITITYMPKINDGKIVSKNV